MGFGQRAIHFKRLPGQIPGPPASFLRVYKTPQAHYGERVRQTCVGRSIGRVFGNCFLKVLDSLSESFPAASVPILTTFQIGFVRLWDNPLDTHEVRLIMRGQFDVDFSRNCLSDFRLQCEHVSEIAVIALSPEMGVCISIYQLRRNTHSIAKTQHSAFYDSVE